MILESMRLRNQSEQQKDTLALQVQQLEAVEPLRPRVGHVDHQMPQAIAQVAKHVQFALARAHLHKAVDFDRLELEDVVVYDLRSLLGLVVVADTVLSNDVLLCVETKHCRCTQNAANGVRSGVIRLNRIM